MILRKISLIIILFLVSCSSSKIIDEKVQDDSTTELSKNSADTKDSNSDEELMDLLGDNETNSEKTTSSSDEVSSDEVSSDEVSSDEVSSDEVSSDEVAGNINVESNSKVRKLKEEIQSLQQSLIQKDTHISSLSDENTQLKNSKATQISYQQPGEEISEYEYEEKYNETYQLFESREYDMAISQFENLIANNASNSLSDNAQYWIGECHFAQRKFKQAILDFEKVFTFRKSNKFEDAQFKIAYCYFIIKDKRNAQVELQRFINQYPRGRNVVHAQEMLSSL